MYKRSLKRVHQNAKGSTFIEVLLSMVVLGSTLVGSQFAVLTSMRYLHDVYQDGYDLREQASQSAAKEITIS